MHILEKTTLEVVDYDEDKDLEVEHDQDQYNFQDKITCGENSIDHKDLLKE